MADVMYSHTYLSPLGPILLRCTDEALTGLWFEGQKHFAEGFDVEKSADGKGSAVVSLCCSWLDIYFRGERPAFTPPVFLEGSRFQKRVWAVLSRIAYGKTMTYKEIAACVSEGESDSSLLCRAVGNAVGRNPVSLIVPCHRVLGSDGSLTGYAGGIGRKRALLELERGVDTKNTVSPAF